ncbi:hypothetical protein [Microcystis phage MJing1]|nr:hypothetical protein [Microcystis phage MJing1]
MSDIIAKLQRALDLAGNTHTIEDVARAARRGEVRVAEHGESVIVTELVHYPRLLAARHWLYAGRLVDMPVLEEEAARWARAEGATRIEISGRRGWQPILAPHGYRPNGVVGYTKEIAA